MIQLASKNLSIEATNRLASLQEKVNAKAEFNKKVARAQQLWKSKKKSNIGQTTFAEIEVLLTDLYIASGICQYCENNEPADIEHIFPKSFFPNFAFVWENYLLVCKLCNSGFKLDKCFVLDENGDCYDTERGKQPLHNEVAIINPRRENPNDFMLLNLQTFKYISLPNLSQKQLNKVNKTLEILQLNERDPLIRSRRKAAQYFYDRMSKITQIMAADSVDDIEEIVSPYDNVLDLTQSLEQIKIELKSSFKNDIQTHQHPSVWHSIKVIESKVNSKWQRLFTQLPEALEW